MSDIDYDGEKLRGAGTFLAGKAVDIPTASILSMGSVSASDVTAAANNFNLWFTYVGLTARAQIIDLGDQVADAATALDQAEAQTAAAAVTP